MDEIISLLRARVNQATGELHLDEKMTIAFFRWMAGRAFVDKELENCAERLRDFAERFLKSSGGSSEILRELTNTVDAIEHRPR